MQLLTTLLISSKLGQKTKKIQTGFSRTMTIFLKLFDVVRITTKRALI